MGQLLQMLGQGGGGNMTPGPPQQAGQQAQGGGGQRPGQSMQFGPESLMSLLTAIFSGMGGMGQAAGNGAQLGSASMQSILPHLLPHLMGNPPGGAPRNGVHPIAAAPHGMEPGGPQHAAPGAGMGGGMQFGRQPGMGRITPPQMGGMF